MPRMFLRQHLPTLSLRRHNSSDTAQHMQFLDDIYMFLGAFPGHHSWAWLMHQAFVLQWQDTGVDVNYVHQ